MTETGFYILLCLQKPMHGYAIVQKVDSLTDGVVRIGAGTLYGSLSKMEKDGLIRFMDEQDKRKNLSDHRTWIRCSCFGKKTN